MKFLLLAFFPKKVEKSLHKVKNMSLVNEYPQDTF